MVQHICNASPQLESSPEINTLAYYSPQEVKYHSIHHCDEKTRFCNQSSNQTYPPSESTVIFRPSKNANPNTIKNPSNFFPQGRSLPNGVVNGRLALNVIVSPPMVGNSTSTVPHRLFSLRDRATAYRSSKRLGLMDMPVHPVSNMQYSLLLRFEEAEDARLDPLTVMEDAMPT
mmetsp:Transcript_24753/g.42358  ORF Transcript_24753/g.42358 Transcript_24753/m.42358 type:complete len:174 (-) Transcript_24753:1257-1778(-)